MLILVLGGSASGKSEYAENLTIKVENEKKRKQNELKETKIYLATMQPYDDEIKKRIEKHCDQRKDKGFFTIEKYCDISDISVPEESIILLECMSNLLANELYREGVDMDLVGEKILADIEMLLLKCNHLIIVSNDVFHDGCEYSEETRMYLDVLGMINQRLGERADRVTEVVCGIPFHLKVSEETKDSRDSMEVECEFI